MRGMPDFRTTGRDVRHAHGRRLRVEFVRCFALVEAAWQRRRNVEFEYYSIMKSDRSMRPSSRRALASWLYFGDAESFFKIVEGTTARVVIDAAR